MTPESRVKSIPTIERKIQGSGRASANRATCHVRGGRFSINEDPGRSSPTEAVRSHVRDVVYEAQKTAIRNSLPCRATGRFLCLLEG